MKNLRLHLTAIVLFSAFFVHAQIGQGTVLLGGVGGFDIQLEDPDNIISFDLFPDVGFFVTDNIAVGGSLGFGYSKRGDHSNTSFSIAPFGRIYFGGDGGPAFFIHAQAGYFTSKAKDDTFETTFNGPFFSGGPGVAIFLSDEIAIDLSVLYNRESGDFDTDDIGLFFGVQAYLGRGE
jgi:outer membrane protein